MIEIHKLEADEYATLSTIEEGYVPDPMNSIALIATDGDKIIGRMFLVAPAHVECAWVKKEYRSKPVLSMLMAKIESCAKDCGHKNLLVYAISGKVESYLDRRGYTKVPVTVWSKEKIGPLCLQP